MDAIDPNYNPADGRVTLTHTGTPFQFGAGLRQWTSVKVQGHELNKAFQHIVDNDGKVEGWQYIGGRDWVIFWSAPVTR